MMLNNGGWDLSAWDHSNGIFILLLRLGSIHSFAFSFTGYYQLRKFLGASWLGRAKSSFIIFIVHTNFELVGPVFLYEVMSLIVDENNPVFIHWVVLVKILSARNFFIIYLLIIWT